MATSEHCALCGCELTRGNNINPTGRSSHHRIPKRLERWTGAFSEELRNEEMLMCYFCHEQLLHNPILLPGTEERLAELFAGKGPDEKLLIFAEVIERGAAGARP